ncbi:Nuclease-related domain-containing protein [Bacillus sp. OV322]|nr:Nuclease-related domain-containing protein [Bacillus sp. OV322]
MVIKERVVPIYNEKLEALLRRLPQGHAKRQDIADELAKRQAGFRGEQSLDYHLSFLPKDYCILHDLRLSDQDRFFQIDTLIITPSFILILEVKNFSGTLFFDTAFHQLIRTLNGKEEAFPDPVLQVKRQQRQLSAWLESKKFISIPIEALVVVASPYTIIKGNHELQRVVTHSGNFENLMNKLEKKHTEDVLSKKEMRKLSNLLLRNHTPSDINILQRFYLSKKDLLPGVWCPCCEALSMIRAWGGRWICNQCQQTSTDAHIQALQDYILLFGPVITGPRIREFLRLPSKSVTTKLIKSLNLPSTGTTKDRIYHLN